MAVIMMLFQVILPLSTAHPILFADATRKTNMLLTLSSGAHSHRRARTGTSGNAETLSDSPRMYAGGRVPSCTRGRIRRV